MTGAREPPPEVTASREGGAQPLDLGPDASPRRKAFLSLRGAWVAFTWSVTQTFRRRLTWVGTVLVTALAFLLGYIQRPRSVHALSNRDRVHDLWEAIDVGILPVVLPLIALSIIAPAFRREISRRTLVFHLTRPIGRRTLYLVRFAAALPLATLVGTLFLGAFALGFGLDLPTGFYLALPLTAFAGVFTIGALYYLLATLFRRGLVAGLLYTFILEAVLASSSGDSQLMAMTYHVQSVHHATTGAWFEENSARVRREVARREDPDLDFGDVMRAAEGGLSQITEELRLPYEPMGDALRLLGILAAIVLALGAQVVRQRDFPLKE